VWNQKSANGISFGVFLQTIFDSLSQWTFQNFVVFDSIGTFLIPQDFFDLFVFDLK
jgi:hypothetical protein